MSRRRNRQKQPQQRQKAPESKAASSSASNRAIAKFIAIFVAISAAGVGFEYYLMRNDSGQSYRGLVAETGSWLPAACGIDAEVAGSSIHVNRRRLLVTPECSGVEAVGIFLAGVIGFPCGRRKTLIGVAIGLIGVGVLNVLRISVLIIIAAWWRDAFGPAHDALTHLFPLFAVLPLWLMWLLIAFRPDKIGGADAGKGEPRQNQADVSSTPSSKGD